MSKRGYSIVELVNVSGIHCNSEYQAAKYLCELDRTPLTDGGSWIFAQACWRGGSKKQKHALFKVVACELRCRNELKVSFEGKNPHQRIITTDRLLTDVYVKCEAGGLHEKTEQVRNQDLERSVFHAFRGCLSEKYPETYSIKLVGSSGLHKACQTGILRLTFVDEKLGCKWCAEGRGETGFNALVDAVIKGYEHRLSPLFRPQVDPALLPKESPLARRISLRVLQGGKRTHG